MGCLGIEVWKSSTQRKTKEIRKRKTPYSSSMKLLWTPFLASVLPTPQHHPSHLCMAMHGHLNPFQSPPSNLNPSNLANLPFIQPYSYLYPPYPLPTYPPNSYHTFSLSHTYMPTDHSLNPLLSLPPPLTSHKILPILFHGPAAGTHGHFGAHMAGLCLFPALLPSILGNLHTL